MRNCKCGATIHRKNQSGNCRSCSARAAQAARKGTKLTPEQIAKRVEHLRRIAADPDVMARRNAKMAAKRADPEFKRRHAEACRASAARRLSDPKVKAIYQANGRKFGAPNLDTPESRAKVKATLRAKAMGWCPEEFWSLNAKLKANGYRLEERKEIIRAEIPGTREHARRKIASVSLQMQLKQERELAQQF